MLVNNTQRTIKAAMGPLPPVNTTTATTATATSEAPVSPFKGSVERLLLYVRLMRSFAVAALRLCCSSLLTRHRVEATCSVIA
jgi:hypothetical protein